MNTLPRAILLDLDDTILSSYGRPEIAWAKVTASFASALLPLSSPTVATAVADIARAFWSDPAAHKFWRGHLGEARRRIAATALARLAPDRNPEDRAELAIVLADRFTALREEEMHLFDGAAETLDRLRLLGVGLALITNGAAETQRAKIRRFDLEHRFDHIQIEGECGFGKPEERAYTHAMMVLKVRPNEAWMVGDNLEWEVAAPQRLGIHAIWLDAYDAGLPPGSTIRPDRIVRSLTELLAPRGTKEP
ncbi:MAG: HAD family hydrolase [Proteobacteria bacterium]|nr:HAD family hydrolase [Pseudomonadota bacterium]MBI3496011.1 HAD family hydrolase [Pseudomonadota bacterium]